jgi:hypothetical protein
MENSDVMKAELNEIAELGSEPKWNYNNCYFPHHLIIWFGNLLYCRM